MAMRVPLEEVTRFNYFVKAEGRSPTLHLNEIHDYFKPLYPENLGLIVPSTTTIWSQEKVKKNNTLKCFYSLYGLAMGVSYNCIEIQQRDSVKIERGRGPKGFVLLTPEGKQQLERLVLRHPSILE